LFLSGSVNKSSLFLVAAQKLGNNIPENGVSCFDPPWSLHYMYPKKEVKTNIDRTWETRHPSCFKPSVLTLTRGPIPDARAEKRELSERKLNKKLG